MYNDHAEHFQTYVNVIVSKMQMQMFEMPNPKVIKRKNKYKLKLL